MHEVGKVLVGVSESQVVSKCLDDDREDALDSGEMTTITIEYIPDRPIPCSARNMIFYLDVSFSINL